MPTATFSAGSSNNSIPTFKLNDGKNIPAIAWGNGTGDAKPTAVRSGIHAINSGVVHIDTAQGYDNEEETGRSIKESGKARSELYLTTKLSQEGGAADKDPIAVEDVRASVQSSLKRLGTQPDLLLVHNPFVPPRGSLVAFWRVLEDMVEKGELTASLGVSNFRPQDLEELCSVAKIMPVANQLEYHPFVLTHLQPVLALHKKYNIVTESYGPLSPLLRHPSKGAPIKAALTKVAERLSKESGIEVDEAMALLKWTEGMGVVAVTASGNEGRIRKIGQVQALPPLTQAELDEIADIGRKYHFRAYTEHMEVDFPTPDLPKE